MTIATKPISYKDRVIVAEKASGTKNGYYHSYQVMDRPWIVSVDGAVLLNARGKPRRFEFSPAAVAAAVAHINAEPTDEQFLAALGPCGK
jgi:hypothetical protein